MPLDALQLRSKLDAWITRYRPQLVILHGSRLTGLEGPEADLDLAVLFKQYPSDLGKVISDLNSALDEDVDLMILNHAEPIARAAAVQRGEPVYEDSPGRYANYHSYVTRQYMDTEKLRRIRRELLDDYLTRKGYP